MESLTTYAEDFPIWLSLIKMHIKSPTVMAAKMMLSYLSRGFLEETEPQDWLAGFKEYPQESADLLKRSREIC